MIQNAVRQRRQCGLEKCHDDTCIYFPKHLCPLFIVYLLISLSSGSFKGSTVGWLRDVGLPISLSPSFIMGVAVIIHNIPSH